MSIREVVASVSLFALAACQPATPAAPVDVLPMPAAILADVSFIGSARQEGRAVGSAGSARVANYIVEQYKQLSLRGAFAAQCARAEPTCEASYFQPFTKQNARNARNIGVVIPGSDSSMRSQYVVVGAHYDHIGRSMTMSLDEQKGDSIRPGADDNASGTAAIIELARRLSARPTKRSILVIHFDAEEVGLYGSEYFAANTPVPRRQMRFMLNLDMVGRLSTGKFIVDTTTMIFSNPRLITLLDSAGRAMGLRTSYTQDINGRSDHESLRVAGVPAIALFTGFHSDYHRTTDVVSKLDVRGIRRMVDVSEAIVRLEGDRR